ncbi:FecR/PupR family sigma factor regulator [Novosphingobium sp. BL-52-GroH]|uniref:FecR/PupR family sigma factor regulator n=1 Tax=Novosphingobium sp. BL-52-GroH TaxID=3349877 RepID=UPI00384DE642
MGSGQQDDPPSSRSWQDAEDDAIAWMIALREEPEDLPLRRRFQQWHDADPTHRAAWAELRHVDGRTRCDRACLRVP